MVGETHHYSVEQARQKLELPKGRTLTQRPGAQEEQEAWEWLWRSVNENFFQNLRAASVYGKALENSRSVLENNVGLEKLSNEFFVRLFETAPSLSDFFVKPAAQQSQMFKEALDLILSAASDPDVLRHGLKDLALRHLKYKLQPSGLQLFGRILLDSITDLLEAHVKDGAELSLMIEAWYDLWEQVYEVFVTLISADGARFADALINGTDEELVACLDEFPRGIRTAQCLNFKIEGSQGAMIQ